MNITLGRPAVSEAPEPGEDDHRELRSLRPNRVRWRAAMARPDPLPLAAPRREPWAAAAALVGAAGTAGLAVLAATRPDLGDGGVAALVSALAAACAPILLCWRLAVVGRAPSVLPEPRSTGLDARQDLAAERVAAARPETSETQPDPGAAGAPAAVASPIRRRHARITPRNTRTFIATEDGRRLNALIIDVSQSGVAIQGNLPGLWIGSMVTVGSRRAKAVRILPRGIAFEFSTPVAAEALTADFVL